MGPPAASGIPKFPPLHLPVWAAHGFNKEELALATPSPPSSLSLLCSPSPAPHRVYPSLSPHFSAHNSFLYPSIQINLAFLKY